MEHFSELAEKRRSHRKFTDERLTEEQIQSLLDVALMAPTSKGLHSYSFCVVENPETLVALSQCKDMGSQFASGAQCAIVVMADPEISDVWIEDASTAAMSILYQSEALGLGAVWTGVYPNPELAGPLGEFLGLPENVKPLCAIPIGHHDGTTQPKDKWKPENIHYGKW